MKRCLLLFLFPLTLVSADFTVIKDGKLAVRIDLAQPDAPVIRYAAQELRNTLSRMAEGEISIAPLSNEENDAPPRIVIGTYSSLPPDVQAKLQLPGKSDDEVLVQEHGGSLWITGPTERAALYATYTFLREAADVRWLWPGEDGARIPRRQELVLRQEIRQSPDMPHRNLALISKQQYDDETHVWMARNRMNIANLAPWRPDENRANLPRIQELGFRIRMSGHIVVLPRQLLEKHPEYMALYSGERRSFHHHGAHLCWSNPDVQKALCDQMIKMLDLYPELEIASLYLADHSNYCQCDNCVAIAPDISTRWQELSKILIKAMKAHRPSLSIWSIAYLQYRPAPSVVAPYDHIQYAISDASYRRPFTSGSSANTKALTAIAEWQKKGMNMGLRQYEMIGLRNPNVFMPLVYFMADQFNYARAHQLTSYSSEITPHGFPDSLPPEEQHWNVNRMNVYAAAQAMWNSSLSSEEIVRDWATHAYHDAAPAMTKYYLAMQAAWQDSPRPINHYFNDASTQLAGFISPKLIERAEAALSEAREQANQIADRKDRETALSTIELDARMFGVWRRLYRNGTREGDPSIYRLLPYDSAADVASWASAPIVPVGKEVQARMLWDQGVLKLRWSGNQSLTVRLHSIASQGEFVEIALPVSGAPSTHQVNWGTRTPLDLAVKLQPADDREREALITIPQAKEMLERYDRLYLSLHTDNAQWPTAPLTHGLIRLNQRPTPRLGFIDGAPGASSGVHELLRLQGWESHRTQNAPEEILAQADFTIMNYDDGKHFTLPEKQMRALLTPYFERGGILMVYTTGALPVKQWLNDPALSFQRVGKDPQDVLRRLTKTTRPGNWLTEPNVLKYWKTGNTPVFGFAPSTPERWEIFATVEMKDGQEVPWLMATRIGKGWLLVTSEPMGYGGGFSMFGNRVNERTGPFIENLIRELTR